MARLLREIYPDCKRILIRYIGHLTTQQAMAELNVSRDTIQIFLAGRFRILTRRTVVANNWMEVLPRLHPGATPQEKRRLKNWLKRTIGDCPLAPFISHLKQEEVADRLGISHSELGHILYRGVTPHRHVVMGNEWKKIVSLLHPALARGKPVPKKDLQRLNEWFEDIIGSCPLAPFVGHLQYKQAAEPHLGISHEFLGQILDGRTTPSRQTVLANNWREVLPKLHPCAVKGEPIPAEDLEKLNAWLDGIVGAHVLHRFLGHLSAAERSKLLGVSEAYFNDIVAGKLPSIYTVGANDWRNKLLKAHPEATAEEIADLNVWLLDCWNADIFAKGGARKEWRRAVGEVFRTLRGSRPVDQFLSRWECPTRAEKQLRNLYPRLEAGTYGTQKTMRDELDTYLYVAREICRQAGITGAKALQMEQQARKDTLVSDEKTIFNAYRRLLALMPPLAQAGNNGLPVFPAAYTNGPR